jgi:hypothetical protein
MLQRREEFVPQKGITISPECIPLPRVKLVDTVMEA